MREPIYTSAAHQDLAGIVQFVARDKIGAALALVDKIEAKCLFLADNPSLGDPQPQLGTGVRATAVGRFVIYYREMNAQVEILRVIPGDRDVRKL